MSIVHTGLFSKKANEILNSVIGQMSDGMWENSNSMNKYWMFARIEQAENGENVIEIKNERCTNYCGKYVPNGFDGLNANDILDFFAKKIKQIIKQEMKDNNADRAAWKRDNTDFHTQYLSYDEHITVADVYYIYEYLLNRPSINRKYETTIVNGIVGVPRSDEEIARARARNEITAKATADRVAANEEFNKAMEQLKREFAKKERELKEIRDRKCNEITCRERYDLEELTA